MPRGWIDDLFESHPKRELVSLAADGLLMRAISISNRHLTDGFVSDEWVRQQLRREGRRAPKVLREALEAPLLEQFDAHTSCTIEAPKVPGLRLSARLIAVGPFRLAGYLIHDFFACNRARIEVEEKRANERGRKRIERGQTSLPLDPPPPDVRTDVTTSGRGPGREEGSTSTNGAGELDARLRAEELPPGQVGEVMAILDRADRLQLTGMMDSGIESAIAAHPGKDPIAAAHTVVAWVSDPAFRKTSPTGVFLDALRTQPEHVAATPVPTTNAPQRAGGLCVRCRANERAASSGPYCEDCVAQVA
jgi:hypothetical protein